MTFGHIFFADRFVINLFVNSSRHTTNRKADEEIFDANSGVQQGNWLPPILNINKLRNNSAETKKQTDVHYLSPQIFSGGIQKKPN